MSLPAARPAPSALPVPPHRRPDAAGVDIAALSRVLCDLGQVDRLADLGRHGPLLASAGARSLFHCLFGRDAIQMAFDLLDDFPAVAQATILELARLQGVRHDPRAEEEPGRIIHEHRDADDPIRAALEEHWSFPYYGAVDSTPRWVTLLAAYCARHGTAILDTPLVGRLGRAVTLRDALRAALGWITSRMDDPTGGGYVWVRRASPHGIPNQVWEDSPDSYYHADGTLFDVSRPYAPVAVQGYAYDALLDGADLLAASGNASDEAEAAALRARAADLRARTLRDFWQEDLGTFALALTFDEDADGADAAEATHGVADAEPAHGAAEGAAPGAGRRGRPARLVASSPGHLLASRLLDGADAAAVRARLVDRLFEDDLLAGAGVRTRAVGAARFRPGSYHNGSTWPMDTGIIADGLRRHGETARADELEDRILAGCASVGGFPEFFRGDPDGGLRVNTTTIDDIVDGVLNRLEQPPQANQGWTATRVWRILRRRGLVAEI